MPLPPELQSGVFDQTRRELLELLDRTEQQVRDQASGLLQRSEEEASEIAATAETRARQIVEAAEERSHQVIEEAQRSAAQIDAELERIGQQIDSLRTTLRTFHQERMEVPAAEPTEPESSPEGSSDWSSGEHYGGESSPPQDAWNAAQEGTGEEGAGSPEDTLKALRAALDALNGTREEEHVGAESSHSFQG